MNKIIEEAKLITKKRKEKKIFTVSLNSDDFKHIKTIAYKQNLSVSSIFQAMLNKFLEEELSK